MYLIFFAKEAKSRVLLNGALRVLQGCVPLDVCDVSASKSKKVSEQSERYAATHLRPQVCTGSGGREEGLLMPPAHARERGATHICYRGTGISVLKVG